MWEFVPNREQVRNGVKIGGVSGFRDRGRTTRLKRVQALLQPIEAYAGASSDDHDAQRHVLDAVRSAAEASQAAIRRLGMGGLVISLLLAGMLAYQSWWLARLAAQADAAHSRLSIALEQNELLRSQSALTKELLAQVKSTNALLRAQVQRGGAQDRLRDRVAASGRAPTRRSVRENEASAPRHQRLREGTSGNSRAGGLALSTPVSTRVLAIALSADESDVGGWAFNASLATRAPAAGAVSSLPMAERARASTRGHRIHRGWMDAERSLSGRPCR